MSATAWRDECESRLGQATIRNIKQNLSGLRLQRSLSRWRPARCYPCERTLLSRSLPGGGMALSSIFVLRHALGSSASVLHIGRSSQRDVGRRNPITQVRLMSGQ